MNMNSPEEFNPVLMGILAVLAWGALFVSLRRAEVARRKEERVQREEMENLRKNYLRTPQM